MGRKFCVTNYKGNHDSANKAKVFRLPKNPEESERWVKIMR